MQKGVVKKIASMCLVVGVSISSSLAMERPPCEGPMNAQVSNGRQYRCETEFEDIGLQRAWDAGLSGNGVTIAVIDSGLNYDTFFANTKITKGRAFYYREEESGPYSVPGSEAPGNYYGNSNPDALADDTGHGTMVTQVIASIAPNATIMPIKASFSDEDDRIGDSTSCIVSGIEFAIANEADIINISMGFTENSTDELKEAIDKAVNAGCIIVASAGNDGTAETQYPAGFDNVISVGATNSDGELTDYSQKNATVNICAPGNATFRLKKVEQDNGVGWEYTNQGTSFSAPIITGVIALLKENNPGLTQEAFLSFAQGSCDPIEFTENSDVSPLPYCGAGKINVANLMEVMDIPIEAEKNDSSRDIAYTLYFLCGMAFLTMGWATLVEGDTVITTKLNKKEANKLRRKRGRNFFENSI